MNRFLGEEKWGFAHEWAMESIAHSVGIFHPDYLRAKSVSR